jgi:hypothetical protein
MNLLRSLRIVSTFAATLASLVIIPIGNLRVPGAFSPRQFLALFIFPALLLGLATLVTLLTNRSLIPPCLTVLGGICEGLAVALGLAGLATVIFWYEDSGRPHLEPLFVLLGLATAAAETSSRRIRSLMRTDNATLRKGDSTTASDA